MSVTGWKSPGTCANVDRDASQAWDNPDNAKTSNNQYVTSSFLPKETYTDWLRCTNFPFTTDDLPTNATVDGVELRIEKYGASIIDSAIYLRKTAGQIGDNKASATEWPNPEAYVTYGGAADDWNATLADTDIRSSDFGVDISAYNSDADNPHDPVIDHVQIRIYYTEVAGGVPGGMMRLGVGGA